MPESPWRLKKDAELPLVFKWPGTEPELVQSMVIEWGYNGDDAKHSDSLW